MGTKRRVSREGRTLKHFTPKIIETLPPITNLPLKTFPGLYPTRVFFRLTSRKGSEIVYLGKPSFNAYRQLRNALVRRRHGTPYFIAEFDREGIRYICTQNKSGRTMNKVSTEWVKLHPGNYYDSSMTWMAGAAGKSVKRNGIYGLGEAF